MRWLFLALALLALGAGFGFVFWRRWIEPWTELEELVRAVVEQERPRKFLMTGNARANSLGLALEKFANRQRELEQSATAGTQSLQSVLGALPDGLVLVDQHRRIQLTNPQFQNLFRLRDETRGVGLLEIVRDAGVDRSVTAALESGELRSEHVTLGRDLESRRELEVTAVPFATGDDGTRNAVVLFRDVTQMRRVEDMRRDFVANVSHELRTPLSIFRGYLETLLEDPQQPPAEVQRILEVMDRHAERLTLLVEDILSLARLETPGMRLDLNEVCLPELLAGIMRDWEKHFAAKALRGELEAPEGLPVIRADEHRLEEVIYNLLDNAVKYSPPEGKIVLRAERRETTVCVSVSDTGVGIPARDLPRIFERFYRADKARSRELGGTGLGLSIVKHIAQLHGGSVEATSEPGRGTTVSVILPLEPPSANLEPEENAQPRLPFD